MARNTKPRSSGTPLTARLHSLAGFRSFGSTPQRTWPDRLPFTFVVRLRRRCSVYMQSEQLWPATSQPTRSVPNYRRATSHQRPEKRHRDRERSVFSFAGDEYVTARWRRQYRTFSEADGLDLKTVFGETPIRHRNRSLLHCNCVPTLRVLVRAAFVNRVVTLWLRWHQHDVGAVRATLEVRARRINLILCAAVLPNQAPEVSNAM